MDPSTGAAALAIAVGIQQLLETIDAVLLLKVPEDSPWRGAIMKCLALLFGLLAASSCKECMQIPASLVEDNFVRYLLTSLALAGGTEGVNSLLKYAKYVKENKKGEAAARRADLPQLELHALSRK